MITTATALDISALGVRVELRRTAADTGGELIEFDVVGRARGLLAAEHVHTGQSEHYEVIEGALRLVVDGAEHVLGPGDELETPAGVRHRQLPGGDGTGRVRVTLRPAGRTEEFLRRLASLDYNRFGYPRPVDAAAIVRDFGAEGHAARPSLRVQRALSRAVLAVASREYRFVDEWDVAAPREAVFRAISDGRTYPQWWKPVYIAVEADGEPEVGKTSRQHFKGRLPYHLRTRSTITRLEPPEVIEADVDGDLRGHGTWTLAELEDGGTHVRFDWQVFADKPLLRVLTPLLRPAFRWNHAWAIARAREGLEPFARP
ncbi:MAG TPA: SRPBCC family protein [Solirubrobacteraceae bacterium]|nr:SRPBCC family protein [Solirubrobacteraceae bacterium]